MASFLTGSVNYSRMDPLERFHRLRQNVNDFDKIIDMIDVMLKPLT